MYKKRVLVLVLVFTMIISSMPWQMSNVSAQELTQVNAGDFFYSEEECNEFKEELKNLSNNNFQNLSQEEKNLFKEFSFLLFTARNALNSPILKDGEGGILVFVNEIKSQQIDLNGILNENTLFEDFENVIKKIIVGNEIAGKNILAKYGLYLSNINPTIRLIPEYNTIENSKSVLVDVVLDTPNEDISNLGIFTFEMIVNYSGELSFVDIKKDGISLISDSTPKYNDYQTYFETFDTTKSGQVAYTFCYKNDNTLVEDEQELVIATLEFKGNNNGIGTIGFDDEKFVIIDSDGTDVSGLISYGTKIKVADTLNPEITNVYVNGEEIEEGGQTTIASNNFTLTGFVDADVDVKISGISVDVDDTIGVFTKELTYVNDGVEEITVSAGNDEYTFTVNIDTTGPEITVRDEANELLEDGLYNDNKTINIDCGDGSFVSATLNNADISGYYQEDSTAYSTTLEKGQEEEYTLVIVAEDILKNKTTKTINFTIDKKYPVITVVGVEDGKTYGQTSIDFSSSEGTPEALLYDVINEEQVNERVYVSGTNITTSGKYSLVVSATDEAGNNSTYGAIFTIDADAPEVDVNTVRFKVDENITEFVKGEDKLDISFDVNETLVKGYLNIGNVNKMISIDETNRSVSYEYNVPSDININSIPITVVLTDVYGNTSDQIELGAISIDNIAPRVFAYIDSELDNGYIKDNSVSVTIETDGDKIIYDINGGDSKTEDNIIDNMIQFDIPTESKDNIKYIVNYEAEDIVGHKASGTLSFTVDNVNPGEPVITNIKEAIRTNQRSISLEGNSGDDSIIVKKDNKIIKVNEGLPVEVKLHKGVNDFVVFAKDQAGNVSDNGTIVPTITKDAKKPLISIDEENGSLVAVSDETLDSINIKYEFDGTDTKATIAAKEGVDNTYEITGVDLTQAGKHVIKVTGTDLAGNVGYGRLTKVTVEEIVTRKTEITEDVDLDEGEFEEGGGTLEVNSVVAAAEEGNEFVAQPLDFSGVQVKQGKSVVIDIYIGSGFPADTKLWYLDDKGDVSPLNNEWIELNGNEHGDSLYNPSESESIVDVNLDGGTYNDIEYEQKTVSIEPGHLVAVLHHFSTYAAMADTTEPEIYITSPTPGAKISDNTLTVTGTLSEDCETVTVNGESASIVEKEFSANISVSQGDMSITVVAVDTAGNDSTETFDVSVDTIEPTVALEGPELTNDSFINLTLDVDDANGVTTKVYKNDEANLDNLVFTTNKKGTDIEINSVSTDATKYIAVATDVFGNIEKSTYTVGLDKDAPVITISGVSDNEIVTQSINVSVLLNEVGSWTAKLYENGILVGTYNKTFTIKEKGEHNYKLVVTAEDKAKNQNYKEITFTVNIETQNTGNHSSKSHTPVQETSDKAKVTTKGGSFELLDGEIIVAIEKDTFGESVEISVEVIDEDIPALPAQTNTTKLMLAGNVYEFDAKGKAFNKPVEITLSYDEDLVDDATKLGIYVYNEDTNKWDYVGGKVDINNGTVTVTLNHFSKYVVMEYDRTFTDVSSHWAKEDIELMAARHIANGMTTTTFAPQGKITRAQFATLLVRALGLEISQNSNSFTDVNDEWFAGYVTTAYEAGLVNGMNATKFAPKANITREQMAAMIMRAYTNKTNNDYKTISTSTDARFNDESNISTWAHHAVLIANDLSIINGMGDNKFAPKADATRAQAIVMIKRLLEATDSL